MIKRLLGSVREFRKEALLTPFFVVLSALMTVAAHLLLGKKKKSRNGECA